MSEYQWRPVDGMRKEIRVLDLDPGTGTASLSGQLRHVFLDESDKADFITISYAWGDAALVDEVSVDGKIVPIPASAGSALRCMRSPVETHTFWIDCICIDQYNVQEKGHQVGLMADIFQYSTGTLAHLGDDHDNTAKRAFDGFLAVSEAWQESYRQQSDVNHAGIENIEIQNWSSLRETIDMAAIKAIMQKAYFTGLWIVQEAVLSSKTMLCCGTWSISLHAFAIAAIWFSSHPSSDFTDDVYEDEQFTNVESFLGIVNAVYHGELSLTKALHLAIWLQCSEPRDRVFGLLGLLKLSTQESSVLVNLAPDYTKSVADVYSDATRACIAECNPPLGARHIWL